MFATGRNDIMEPREVYSRLVDQCGQLCSESQDDMGRSISVVHAPSFIVWIKSHHFSVVLDDVFWAHASLRLTRVMITFIGFFASCRLLP